MEGGGTEGGSFLKRWKGGEKARSAVGDTDRKWVEISIIPFSFNDFLSVIDIKCIRTLQQVNMTFTLLCLLQTGMLEM